MNSPVIQDLASPMIHSQTEYELGQLLAIPKKKVQAYPLEEAKSPVFSQEAPERGRSYESRRR